MIQSQSHLNSPNAGQYLARLCQHFAHKVEVVEREGRGEIRFSCGTARLAAECGTLAIHVESQSPDDLEETKQVVERHLARFAFREEIAPLSWNSPQR